MDSVVSKYPNLNHKIVNIDANTTNAIDYAFDDHENYKEIIPIPIVLILQYYKRLKKTI